MAQKQAGIGRRVLAYVLDTFIIWFVMLLAWVFFATASFEFTYGLDWQHLLYLLWALQLPHILYMLLRDGIFKGQSPGKRICKIAVVREEGKTGAGASALRNFLLVLPGFLLVEFIMLIVSKNGQRLGDMIARTTVVSETKARPLSKAVLASLIIALLVVCGSFAAYGQSKYDTKFDTIVIIDAPQATAEQVPAVHNAVLDRIARFGILVPEHESNGNALTLVMQSEHAEEDFIERLFMPGAFSAKIGDETVYTGVDIIEVGLSAYDSGIQFCQPGVQGYFCVYYFSITVSEEAAQRLADVTANLEVVGEEKLYINETLVLQLDGENITEFNIAAALQGVPETQIQISGSEVGPTEPQALDNTLEQMRLYQVLLATEPLETPVEIVSIEQR